MRATEMDNFLDPLGTVIIGGGPAALALLLAARRTGGLPAILRQGLRILEKDRAFGAGEIGRYSIRSDSHADSFINALSDSHIQLRSASAHRLEAQRGTSAALEEVGSFLHDLGALVRRELAQQAYDPVVQDTKVLRVQRDPTGAWLAHCEAGHAPALVTYKSRCVVIATGGFQSEAEWKTVQVAGLQLYPRHREKIIASADFLSSRFQRELNGGNRRYRHIAILGGSHSALASANAVLTSSAPYFSDSSVAILHRSDLRITYQSPDSAWKDGYTDFSEGDICRKTGRVYPLAGFRSESRDLLRAQWALGGLNPNPRLELIDLRTTPPAAVSRTLDDADLVVCALGYQSRGIEVIDANGDAIMLSGQSPRSPMVNGASQVLDASGTPVPGLYGIGMAAGYPLAGIHGESSFTGQANGWALWRRDIGEDLSRTIVDKTSDQPVTC